jgi:biopolymer transport protein ExbB/TolQ
MVVIIGMVVAEVFTERRYFKLSLPNLIDDLQRTSDIENVIRDSGMLGRQKTALLELLRHEDATETELESLAVDLTFQERAHFDARVKVTDLISKIAPMFGLMGTLIPLGPGIVAIGGGDTAVLSSSLQIAFDTTVLGLIVGALALLVSTIRKSWYAKYMSTFESAAECVLEKACERVRARGKNPNAIEPSSTAEAALQPEGAQQ